MRLYLEFDRIVRALATAKIRFAVAGGMAVGLHGYLRATRDIDLLIRPVDLDKVRAVMKQVGYQENPAAFSFRKSGLGLRRFFWRPVGAEELFVLDILLAESKETLRILREARPQKYANLQLRVVRLPDLYRMKRLRGSKQDEADIEELEKRHAKKRKRKNAR